MNVFHMKFYGSHEKVHRVLITIFKIYRGTGLVVTGRVLNEMLFGR